jgi:NAD(P)-dependent dehydrogenase (short-subunit alcohol dehydrogenase family)
MARKVWFITGSSRGLGRHWANAALQRGDLVAATARDINSLIGLTEAYGDAALPLQLDVVVNNAGYGLAGAVEEVSEAQVRAQLETNFFGALWITQAALPYLREQRSGHIVQVSSIGGILTYPGVSLYCASKWALEAISEALAQEVAGFGVHVILVEPGPFATDWAGSSLVWANAHPAAATQAIVALVDDPTPPLRLFLGADALDATRAAYEQRLKAWEQWDDVARAAQGD